MHPPHQRSKAVPADWARINRSLVAVVCQYSAVRHENVAVNNACSRFYIYWNNEELSGLLVLAITRMIGALDVECERGGGGIHREFWWRKVQERDHMQVVGVHGRIMSKLMLQKCDGSALPALMWLRVGTGCCEDGNEPSGSVTFREFFGWMKNS